VSRNQLTKRCVVCGASFVIRHWSQKLCSKACRLKRAQAQRRAWYRDPQNEMVAYMARYHAERREQRNAAARARYYRATGRKSRR
jgi:predicted nucleic acid-binding Zn ribbon protein